MKGAEVMEPVRLLLKNLEDSIIQIGYVGENNHIQVQIDCAEVFEKYPEAVVSMTVSNPLGQIYPAIIENEGNDVLWTVTSSDISCEGDGKIQLTFINGEEIIKTATGKTRIKNSIAGSGPAPDPIVDFVTRADTVLAGIPDVIDSALEEAKESGEFKGDPGEDGYTPVKGVDYFDGKDGQDGEDGQDGDDGISPTVTVTDITGGHRVVITDAEGPHSFDVMDGQGGGGSVTIDDELSDTSTNPVQNKVITEEVTSLKEAIASNPEQKDSTATGIDLDVSDEDGNVIVRMQNGHIRTAFFNSAKYGAKVVTLKTSGGDFSTLKAALDSITDADPDTNPYEIHVYPGEYDTLDGFTQAEIEAADIGGGYTDDSMVGCKLTNGISLIGIGDRSKIILTASLDSTYSAAVRGNISTLNLQGTCRIENLTIKAQRIRYCVHDDFGASGHYERIVRNCEFIGLGTSMSYYPPTTYGAGIANPGITALFEDCDFGYSWGMHTRQQTMTGDSLVILRNCRGLGARVGDQAYENDTAKHTFIFDNCNFTAISISRPNTTVPHCFVQGTNNPKAMLFCPAEDIPVFSNILKAELTLLPVGTVVNVTDGEITGNDTGIKAVKATSIDSALGVIVDKDDLYDYIQTDGFIQGNRLGIQNLAVGDYVTVDADMVLTSGGTASNAFGVVKYTDSNDRSQIWMMGR